MSSRLKRRMIPGRARRAYAQYGRPTYNRPARVPPSGPPRTFSTVGKRGSGAAAAPGDPALLLESGSYLLLEDGSHLLLEA